MEEKKEEDENEAPVREDFKGTIPSEGGRGGWGMGDAPSSKCERVDEERLD